MGIEEGLKEVLKKLCNRLGYNNIEFCLAGGFAVSIIGLTRTTIDIDLLIALDESEKNQVVSILENTFHLIQSHEDEMEFKHMTLWRNVAALHRQGEPYVIDLIKADSDYFKSAIKRSTEIDYEGVIIPVIAIEDLVVLKMFSFRKQDQVDIENLILSNNPIDWNYLETKMKAFDLDWSYLDGIKSQKS